jgi:hypothetical protein
MSLALPAPQVAEAIATAAESVEAATAEMARPSNSLVQVQPPSVVGPATTDYDTKGVHHRQPQTPPMSVEGLRMANGINHFESYAAVLPRAADKTILQVLLPCIYGDRDYATYGEAKKYCFVKDTDCYIYNDHTDPIPLYKISLSPFCGTRHSNNNTMNRLQVYAILEDPRHPDRFSTTVSPAPDTNQPRTEIKTVLLKLRSNNRLLYQVTFDTSHDDTLALRFVTLVNNLTESIHYVTAKPKL